MTINEYLLVIETLKKIIRGTEFEGHVYTVGGCERDKHLRRDIKDIDLVVDLENGGINFAKWLEFNKHTVGSIIIYERFGTAMFKLSEFPNLELEVVQTRKESYNDSESRNPDTSYGTILEDCKRRDFTINALYHNISTNEDLDLTGLGLKDIENGIIRTCGDPDIIFTDDPLRILRAVRFATQLKFGIDEDTQFGMSKYAKRLKIISKERIQSELNKIFEADKPYYAFWTMNDLNITDYIFIGADKKLFSVYDKYLIVAHDNLIDIGDKVIQCFTIMAYVIGIKTTLGYMHDLKYPNSTINCVEKYFKCISTYIDMVNRNDMYMLHKFEYLCGNEKTYDNVVELLMCFNIFNVPKTKHPMYDYKLPINGNDVMKYCNLKQGKDVKNVLEKLLDIAFHKPTITKFGLKIQMILIRLGLVTI